MNSLNLAQHHGYGVGHIDHPGTTLQMIGAITIWVVQKLYYDKEDIVQSVFTNPETYLNKISLVLILMIAFALFILGFVTYKTTGNVYIAMLLQSSPFFSPSVLKYIINVSPEPVLVLTVILIISVTISFLNEKDLSEKKTLKYVLGYGILCGFGLATKISFLPILAIPIILIKKFSNKIALILSSLIFFLMFVFPAISKNNILRFSEWIKSLVTHSDKYGGGDKNFINLSNFLRNLISIFESEVVFAISFLLICILIVFKITKRFRIDTNSDSYNKLLLALFVSMSLQIIIVAKHFEIYYMIPVTILSVFSLFVMNSIIINSYPKYFNKGKYFYLYLALFLLFSFSLYEYSIEIKSYKYKRDEYRKVINYVETNYKNYPVICSNMSSSKYSALFSGVLHSGLQRDKYLTLLNNLYSDHYSYKVWTKAIELADVMTLRDKFRNYKKLIFHCTGKQTLLDFIETLNQITEKKNIKYDLVFSNDYGEEIYEINIE